ncbi:MAG: crotonase/enoyl-CoA hydratase family protein [Acidimicrobiaceae bacterium]|nr:crotonase/enoyl-CoA hydratase family protein [Acidimicrobiaceae bacterium]
MSVVTSAHGPVVVVTVDDGHTNILTIEVVDEMLRALRAARDEAQALVIAGRPGWFSAGLDQQVFSAGGQAESELMHGATELLLRTVEFPRPTVIACTGTALGAGAVSLLASDYRVGTAGEHRICLNYVDVGSELPPLALALARGRLSPRHLTLACNTAQTYSPQHAIEAGFLDAVTTGDTVKEAITAATQPARRVDPEAFAATRALTCRNLSDTIIGTAGALWRIDHGT